MNTTIIDGFSVGSYPARTVRNRAIRAALNLFAYEACPYNSTRLASDWVRTLPGLTKAGKHGLAAAVAFRVMQGRDRTYTRVVKLDDGTLSLA